MNNPAAVSAQAALLLLSTPRRPPPPLWLPKPQPGPQTMACESKADIVLFGGHAGGGKTWWLCRSPLAGCHLRDYRHLLMRRTIKQALKPGSIWDNSVEMFQRFGARPRENRTDHIFPSGATVTIGGCEHDKNRTDWDGSQIGGVGFDQVEAFSAAIFWYIALSRGRSMSGFGQILATANPVHPEHKVGGWLSRLVMAGGWVSKEDGFAIPGKSGVVRYMYQGDEGKDPSFFDSEQAAVAAFPRKAKRGARPLTVTFIESRLEDNPALEQADPNYRSRLENMPYFERERLIRGNWLVAPTGGMLINRSWFRILPRDPGGYSDQVRAWDIAATTAEEGGQDRTAGVKAGRHKASGRILYSGALAGLWTPQQVLAQIVQTALSDGPEVTVSIPKDPGQAGKEQAPRLAGEIRSRCAAAGMRPPNVMITRPTGSKTTRGKAFMRACEPADMDVHGNTVTHGLVDFIKGEQTEECIEELHRFDGSDGNRDDFYDACVDAYNVLVGEEDGGGIF